MIKYFPPRLTLLRVTERIKLGDQAPIKKQNKKPQWAPLNDSPSQQYTFDSRVYKKNNNKE